MWHCSVAVGYGCHPARQIALLRALTEAAQVRLTVISGLRDDLRRDSYEQLLDPDKIAAIRQRIFSSTAARHFHDVPDYNGETLEQDVEWELQCMGTVGVRRVVMVDLTKPEFRLPVVRVIVPGLEQIVAPDYIPGRRGRAVLAEQP
jgi:ribosomal protein S12 methylthiotransferase accessory factor